MARLNVNPTRMELRSLKTRLATAKRGHKLLKDKSDEMVRQFMIYIRENLTLRIEVEKELEGALKSFLFASAVNSSKATEGAVAVPISSIDITYSSRNIMSVNAPQIKAEKMSKTQKFPYSFITVSSDLDNSVINVRNLLEKIIRLAEIEKTCMMLSNEIERNRRRVNALEHVLIPELEETIKYITMKLDESERANIITLMKVKEIINKQELNQ